MVGITIELIKLGWGGGEGVEGVESTLIYLTSIFTKILKTKQVPDS